jgi:glutathione peroxidase
MKKTGLLAVLVLLIACTSNKPKTTTTSSTATTTTTMNLYSFSANTLEGKPFDFSTLKGKKVLIVNTASECGYTPQYKDLQALWEKYGSTGKFAILGFPCNQFGGQEPGTATEIGQFCTKNYGVTFQMMEKIDVKGSNQHPLYKWLTNKSENGVEDSEVKWNFNKYMVDENGQLIRHLGSGENPMGETIIKWLDGK